MNTVISIFGIIVLIGVSIFYRMTKREMKRKVFFKEQYQQQTDLTSQSFVFLTGATVDQVRRALFNRIPVDDSVKGAFVGGRYRIKEDKQSKIVYAHSSSFMAAGDSDEFSGSVTFTPQENGLRVVARIENWREKDGVTRRAGIEAMRAFIEAVKDALKAADPNVHIELAAAGAQSLTSTRPSPR